MIIFYVCFQNHVTALIVTPLVHLPYSLLADSQKAHLKLICELIHTSLHEADYIVWYEIETETPKSQLFLSRYLPPGSPPKSLLVLFVTFHQAVFIKQESLQTDGDKTDKCCEVVRMKYLKQIYLLLLEQAIIYNSLLAQKGQALLYFNTAILQHTTDKKNNLCKCSKWACVFVWEYLQLDQ